MANYDGALDWLAELYANTMNIIHYMHGEPPHARWACACANLPPALPAHGLPHHRPQQPLSPPHPPTHPRPARTDKYDYERLQMALHDTYVRRLMAYGMAGLRWGGRAQSTPAGCGQPSQHPAGTARPRATSSHHAGRSARPGPADLAQPVALQGSPDVQPRLARSTVWLPTLCLPSSTRVSSLCMMTRA